MKKLFAEFQLKELLREPEFKNFESFFVESDLVSIQSTHLPNYWKNFLREDLVQDSLIKYWLAKGASFNGLSAMLERKLYQVAIAKYSGKNEYALIYFFLQKKKLRIWIGHMPIDKLPKIDSNLNIDLSPLYRIHNGFYNLSYGEPGYLSIDRMEIYQNEKEPEQKGFLKLFEHGTSVMGVDLESKDSKAYIIWGGDEEVEEIESIWMELDRWLVDIIEEYDDVIE